jgi:hypothetical protein
MLAACDVAIQSSATTVIARLFWSYELWDPLHCVSVLDASSVWCYADILKLSIVRLVETNIRVSSGLWQIPVSHEAIAETAARTLS